MYIQMSATRMQTVKQIRLGYKRAHYIIIPAAKYRKVKEDLLVLITLHFKEKKREGNNCSFEDALSLLFSW